MTSALQAEMLSHQKTRDYLTEEINHFITSIFCAKKKGEREQRFCSSETSSLVILPIVIHFIFIALRWYLHCLIYYQPIFPKTKALFSSL